MKSGDSRFPEALGGLGGSEGASLVNRAGSASGLVRGRVSDRCFMSFLRQNTDHGGGRGKSRSGRNRPGRGRALSLSAASLLPV